MKIPVFYKCGQCGDIFEVIGGDIKCQKCGEIICEKLEGEDKLKCIMRNKDLLIFQKFHELRKLKEVSSAMLMWFKDNIDLIPDGQRPMLLLYKLSDLTGGQEACGHVWSWKECKKEN